MSENLVRLTGLWKRKMKKDGSTYLSGNMSPSATLLIFANTRKKTDKDPDFFAFLAAEKAKKQRAAIEDDGQ